MAYGGDRTLFGRDAECADLLTFVEHPDPGPRILTLQGEAGIGKTALWRFALHQAGVRGMDVRSCHCVEAELALPFTALADLCDPLPSDDLAALPAPQRRALSAALLRDEDGHDDPVDPRAVGTGLLGLLREWAAHRPLLIAVDDGHWMDAASATALTFAVRRLTHESVALLVTRRVPGPSTGLPVDLELPVGHSHTVRPEGLSPDDVGRMLRERLGPTGDGSRAEALLQQVVAETDPGRDRAEVLRRIARMRYHADSFGSAVRVLEEALPHATGSTHLLTALHRDLAWAHASAGAIDVALPHAARAEDLLTECYDPALAPSVWSVSAVVGCIAGQGASLDLLDRAAAAQVAPEPLLAFDPASCRAQVLKWTDGFDESRTIYQSLRRRLTEQGNEGSLPLVLFQESELTCWAGDYATASDLAAEGRRIADLTGQRGFSTMCTYVSALVDAHRGRVEPARTAFNGLRRGLDAAPLIIQGWVLTGLGFLELSVGDAAAAHRHFGPLADIARRIGAREPGVFRFGANAVEALLALQELTAAERLTADLEDAGRRLDRPYALATGARCRGMIAAVHGDREISRSAFEEALRAHDRLPQPFERARTELAYGIVLRRAKRRGQAKTMLESASAGFEQLGATLWYHRAHDELDRVLGLTTADGNYLLTPTEQRVCGLVASGSTNREVAATLSISVKTVEVNLTRVYRKLGVRSRTELSHRFPRGSQG